MWWNRAVCGFVQTNNSLRESLASGQMWAGSLLGETSCSPARVPRLSPRPGGSSVRGLTLAAPASVRHGEGPPADTKHTF